ncbi:His-Xaa-Ser system radical SAM maturase HxsC [Pseudodesulfovibrio methanolicus]|uniref:His-Xaa-Ser system radical SAM maturase HxsC n=1 Tax=Pseudodesulfovibrio methanolicus TaxID=3126690 RepID=A0ABZ2IQS5_9BACT
MKTINGEYSKMKDEVVGRLISHRLPLKNRNGMILVTDRVKLSDVGYAGIISTTESSNLIAPSYAYFPDFSSEVFNEGDVVSITPSAQINFLWEVDQQNNVLFLTEACNCRCLMCPQPPQAHNPRLIKTAKQVLNLAPESYEGEICITGGEPTLCGGDFLEILRSCREKYPSAKIIVLTNGKTFSDFDFAKSVAELNTGALFAVSLHADIDSLHDLIVGSENSFQKTQSGLYNLARLCLPVEIRIVVSRINYSRLRSLAEYIFRNYPFSFHVAFMALEVTGLAVSNFERVWIDPVDYKMELEAALHELNRRGMRVSAYNHPLCLIHKRAWRYARKSISAWKNSYLPKCSSCSVLQQCCGVFTTSGESLSSNIKPIC